MNTTLLTGRLTRDPELRYGQSGTAVCKFNLAVRGYKKDDTDFINCTCFGKTAENLAQYQQKGSLIGVEGRLQSGKYDKDGKTIFTLDVIVQNIEFLGSGKKQEANEELKAAEDVFQGEISDMDSEIPF
jgi:single-strand DNA-binding protein